MAEQQLAALTATLTDHHAQRDQVQALTTGGWTAERLAPNRALRLSDAHHRRDADRSYRPFPPPCPRDGRPRSRQTAADRGDGASPPGGGGGRGAPGPTRSARRRWAAVWCMRRGIGPETLTAWQAAVTSLHVAPDDLAQGLATALEQYGTMEGRGRWPIPTRRRGTVWVLTPRSRSWVDGSSRWRVGA